MYVHEFKIYINYWQPMRINFLRIFIGFPLWFYMLNWIFMHNFSFLPLIIHLIDQQPIPSWRFIIIIILSAFFFFYRACTYAWFMKS